MDSIFKEPKPEPELLQCELSGCPNKFPIELARNIIVGYNLPGPGLSAYGCKQHFACSHEHARQLAHACIDEHLEIGNHA